MQVGADLHAHLDKVAGKPDVLRRASDWLPRAPGTGNLRLLNIFERHVCGGRGHL
jgi:hypothetical protein